MGTEVATAKQSRQVIVVEDALDIWDTAKFEHMMRVATFMGRAGLLPEHLKGKSDDETAGNCLMIVERASIWKMSPIALAQASYFLKGRLGFEGKVIQAVAERALGHGFDVSYTGSGEDRRITLQNIHPYTKQPVSVTGTVKQWRTTEKDGSIKGNWRTDPDKQLRYRGVPEWCRHFAPHIIIGVYTEEELDSFESEYQERQRGRQFVEIPSAKMPTEIPAAAEPETIEGRVNPPASTSDIRRTGAAYGGEAAQPQAADEKVDTETGEITDAKPAGASSFVDESEDDEPVDWEANHAAFRDGLAGVKTLEELSELVALHDVDGMPESWSVAMQNLFNEKADVLNAAEAAKRKAAEEAAKPADDVPAAQDPAAAKPPNFGLVRSQLKAAETLRAVENLWNTKVVGQPFPADQSAELAAIRKAKREEFGAGGDLPKMETMTRLMHRIATVKPAEGQTPGKAMVALFSEYIDPFRDRIAQADWDGLQEAGQARVSELAKEARAAKRKLSDKPK